MTPRCWVSAAPPLLASCCHQPLAWAELHPLPTGSSKATAINLFIARRGTVKRPGASSHTVLPHMEAGEFSLTPISSRVHLQREQTETPWAPAAAEPLFSFALFLL